MPTIFNSGTPNIVANIQVDQRTGEFHTASAQVTNFAVGSSLNRNDHIILAPDTIEIAFVIENNDRDPNQNPSAFLGSVSNSFTAYGTRAANEFEKLKGALRKRALFDVVTRHYLYKTMVLVNITADTTSPFSGKLRGRVSFQKYNEMVPEVVDMPASQLNGGLSIRLPPWWMLGRQNGEPIPAGNVSTAQQLVNRLLGE